MRWNFVDIEYSQPMNAHDPRRGEKREIRKVFVIDRVELVLFHQPHEVGELNRNYPTGSQQYLEASDKVVQIGHLRQHVISRNHIRLLTIGGKFMREFLAKKFDDRLNAF